jgi:hypothetical protein
MEGISQSLLPLSLDIIFDYCISFYFYKLNNSIAGWGNRFTDVSLKYVTLFLQENALIMVPQDLDHDTSLPYSFKAVV